MGSGVIRKLSHLSVQTEQLLHKSNICLFGVKCFKDFPIVTICISLFTTHFNLVSVSSNLK